jgi:hypothetical protein
MYVYIYTVYIIAILFLCLDMYTKFQFIYIVSGSKMVILHSYVAVYQEG